MIIERIEAMPPNNALHLHSGFGHDACKGDHRAIS